MRSVVLVVRPPRFSRDSLLSDGDGRPKSLTRVHTFRGEE